MKYASKNEAAHAWVSEMDAISTNMIAKLYNYDPDEWQEVTMPAVYDRVYLYDEEFNGYTGEIQSVNEQDGERVYTIRVNDSEDSIVRLTQDDFDVDHDSVLPMWGTMWSFRDWCDEEWLEKYGGIQALSDCGFQIYESEEFGFFFGIDGAGYDFYESHFIPLYEKRGLQWHREGL